MYPHSYPHLSAQLIAQLVFFRDVARHEISSVSRGLYLLL